MSNSISIQSGSVFFLSGSYVSSSNTDKTPTGSIVSGKWEIDPDDGESVQFRIPKEKLGTTHDRIGFYISSSGKVGIGTKDPATAFDVRDASQDVDPKLARSDKEALLKLSRDDAEKDIKAEKFRTARTIGGVSFDGSANINLPGVNARGDQDTTGNAAITFIDDTSPDASAEGLKATTAITVNPNTGELTLGLLSITFTQGDGRSTFGTIQFTAPDAGGTRRTATINLS